VGSIESFHDLVAWQLGQALAVNVYRLTALWASTDVFTLGTQMRRSSGSVPDNIAEGFGLGTRPTFLKHLRISRGSLCELETQVDRAHRLGKVTDQRELRDQIEICRRTLQGLITSLERSEAAPPGVLRSGTVGPE
jgi:four helix bundle protein